MKYLRMDIAQLLFLRAGALGPKAGSRPWQQQESSFVSVSSCKKVARDTLERRAVGQKVARKVLLLPFPGEHLLRPECRKGPRPNQVSPGAFARLGSVQQFSLLPILGLRAEVALETLLWFVGLCLEWGHCSDPSVAASLLKAQRVQGQRQGTQPSP